MPHEKALQRNISNKYQMIACLYITRSKLQVHKQNIFEISNRSRCKGEKKTECGKR